MANNEGNNALYFIVGGLVVVAMIFGFMVWGPYSKMDINLTDLNPAVGPSSQTDQTKVEYKNDDGSKSISKTTTTHSVDQ